MCQFSAMLWKGQPRYRGSISGRDRRLYALQSAQTCSGTHPAGGRKAAEQSTGPSLRQGRTAYIRPLSPHAFMADTGKTLSFTQNA